MSAYEQPPLDLAYAAYIGPHTGRRLTATSYPYPKAGRGGAAA